MKFSISSIISYGRRDGKYNAPYSCGMPITDGKGKGDRQTNDIDLEVSATRKTSTKKLRN